MVGFTMFSIYPDPREGHHWVHRFMIDRRHQGRGYGRAGVREVLRDTMTRSRRPGRAFRFSRR